MTDRPYVLLSCAMSVDGYIDDASPRRLLLSNAADFDRVDQVRADSDAILIGANTIRRDDPRLLVNSAVRRAQRVARGLPPYPLKATITSHGLDPSHKFFHTGGDKVVYCSSSTVDKVRDDLGDLAVVVDGGEPVSLAVLLDDLGRRGVRRLMVEGGSAIHTQFLTAGLADEVHLVIAPLFVGDADAPRFVNPGVFPQDLAHRMTVEEVRPIGDVVFVRYLVRAQRSVE
jgi:5-amino-6-(5-phosphoribosylamino)uracil reductase